MNERKYKKRLDRNGWMAKVQRFVWGKKTPNFQGYCPFFWFTWFTILILPFYTVVMLVLLPIFGLIVLWNKIPKHPTRPMYATLLQIHALVQEYGQQWMIDNATTKVRAWIDATPDWWNCVLAVAAKRDRKQAKQERADSKDKRRLQWLANRLHYVVKPTIYLAAAIGLYYVVKFLIWALPLVSWPKVGATLLFFAAMAGFVALIFAVVFGAEFLVRWFRRKCPKCPDKVGFWRKVGDTLLIPFEFLWDTLDVIYTRECPLIEWSDETSPIERMDE